MKELTASFNALLQDKRVRSEQSKYESIQRQRGSVINRYKRAYQEFLDLEAGLQGAKRWYAEMKETVESLEKNVETFVNNRRSEGAQLLNQIEQDRSSRKDSQAELERERLRGLMERMSMEPPQSPPKPSSNRPTPTPLNFNVSSTPRYPQTNFQGQYQVPQSPPPTQVNMQQQQQQPPQQATYPSFAGPPTTHSYTPQPANTYGNPAYNPSQYGRTPGPTSPPPNQSTFGPAVLRGPASPPPTQTSFGMNQHYGGFPGSQQQQHGPPQTIAQGYVPPGFVPPPPPPGPPPLGPQQTYHYNQQPQQQQQHQDFQQHNQSSAYPQSANPHSAHPQQNDPWAGLNAWK
jgi:hypothetical protein